MRNDRFGRRMSFSLKHRILLRDIDGAGLAQWAGFRTPNPRVPGSIPGSRKSFFDALLVVLGSLFHYFWDVLGCVWDFSCNNLEISKKGCFLLFFNVILSSRDKAMQNHVIVEILPKPGF